MKTLIILNDPPYGTERSYNGLRLALALSKGETADTITVFLLGDAVLCAKSGQTTPNGYYNLERMVRRIVADDGRVLLCGTCMDARGLDQGSMLDGARRSTMDELAATTRAADEVLVF